MAFVHNSKLAKSEPGCGGVKKTSLPRLAFADKGEADKKSTWKFPHHWIQNADDSDGDGIYDKGVMFLHRGGLRAAWAAAQGARSGQEASPAVKAHLRRHMIDIGMGKEEAASAADISFARMVEIDQELISLGYFKITDFSRERLLYYLRYENQI